MKKQNNKSYYQDKAQNQNSFEIEEGNLEIQKKEEASISTEDEEGYTKSCKKKRKIRNK